MLRRVIVLLGLTAGLLLASASPAFAVQPYPLNFQTVDFTSGTLEYPQYTRPQEVRGLKVPEVLVSGDHGKIAEWREEKAQERTEERRPDLKAKSNKKFRQL